MIRVRKLKLSNHPVLGNLELDFTDSSNKAVDTVIIAGNNGIGKSSLVELLYQIMAHKYHDMPCYVDSIEVDFVSPRPFRHHLYCESAPPPTRPNIAVRHRH